MLEKYPTTRNDQKSRYVVLLVFSFSGKCTQSSRRNLQYYRVQLAKPTNPCRISEALNLQQWLTKKHSIKSFLQEIRTKDTKGKKPCQYYYCTLLLEYQPLSTTTQQARPPTIFFSIVKSRTNTPRHFIPPLSTDSSNNTNTYSTDTARRVMMFEPPHCVILQGSASRRAKHVKVCNISADFNNAVLYDTSYVILKSKTTNITPKRKKWKKKNMYESTRKHKRKPNAKSVNEMCSNRYPSALQSNQEQLTWREHKNKQSKNQPPLIPAHRKTCRWLSHWGCDAVVRARHFVKNQLPWLWPHHRKILQYFENKK